MLKKISYIILSALLLISTIGMIISKHYCGENLVSVSFFNEAESCCNMPGCCHNETCFIQIQDNFSVPQFLDISDLLELDLLGIHLFNENIEFSLKVDFDRIVLNDISPPRSIQKILSLKQAYLL